MSNLWLAIALVSGASLALAAVLLFIPDPDQIRDPVLRGYRATRRREALEAGGLLTVIWPLIRLCTYYAQLVPAKEWKEKTSLKLRNAGEPWGLNPDEFLGLSVASTLLSMGVAVLFDQLTQIGLGLVIIFGFLGAMLPNV